MSRAEREWDMGMTVPWRIELLGGLRATRGDRVITRFRTQRNIVLLAHLALRSQHPHPREVLIELLWPEIDPEAGRNNLRFALHSLRRELEPPDTAPGTVLLADRQSVHLHPAAFTTDVAEFREAVRAGAGAPDPVQRIDLLTRAAALSRRAQEYTLSIGCRSPRSRLGHGPVPTGYKGKSLR